MDFVDNPAINDIKLPVAADVPPEPVHEPVISQPELVDIAPAPYQELDQILQDVNREVKQQPAEPPAAPAGHKLPIALAIIVAVALAAVALAAFKKSSGT